MRILALTIGATVATVVALTVAFGVGHHPASAVTTVHTRHFHGLPYCGDPVMVHDVVIDLDDDCYLPAAISHLPHHVAAVILDGTVYTVSPTLN